MQDVCHVQPWAITWGRGREVVGGCGRLIGLGTLSAFDAAGALRSCAVSNAAVVERLTQQHRTDLRVAPAVHVACEMPLAKQQAWLHRDC